MTSNISHESRGHSRQLGYAVMLCGFRIRTEETDPRQRCGYCAAHVSASTLKRPTPDRDVATILCVCLVVTLECYSKSSFEFESHPVVRF